MPIVKSPEDLYSQVVNHRSRKAFNELDGYANGGDPKARGYVREIDGMKLEFNDEAKTHSEFENMMFLVTHLNLLGPALWSDMFLGIPGKGEASGRMADLTLVEAMRELAREQA